MWKSEELLFKISFNKINEMKLQSLLHLALLVGSWSVVNSKSNSGSNQSNNSTKGIIRHQTTFETRLNHLVVDNIAGRVSSLVFLSSQWLLCRRFMRGWNNQMSQGLICGVSSSWRPQGRPNQTRYCFWRIKRSSKDRINREHRRNIVNLWSYLYQQP